MENKHTPGPWRYDMDECAIVSESEFEETGFGPAGVIVADLTGSMDGTNTNADARLIAAAPELLDLAYQYLSDLRYPPTGDSLQRRIERAEKVIAKARGIA